MRIHPRVQIVNQARTAINSAILAAQAEHGLTYGELTGILAGELGDLAKYQIRQERHPNNPDQPGGLA